MIDNRKYVTKEEIEQARQLDLLSYLQRYRPDELVRVARGVYSLRSHDSLKISNGKWYRWSKGVGGVSALDYLVKVEGMPFVETVRHLCGCTKHWPFPKTTPQPKEPKPFVLPKCHFDNNRVIQYLMQRGISEETIQMCIAKGILYEDYHHNCCFVGKDENGMPRYATIRSSSPYHTFLMDVKGSDKAYSFQIGTPTSKKLFLFESAIDLLSYYELSANKQNNYLSVSGVYQPNKKDTAYTIPASVTKFLTQNPHIKTIHICFDNDNAGCKAANALYKQLSPKYEAFVEPPTQGKDYNDQLLYERGLPKTFKTRIIKNHNKEDLTK